MTILEAYRAILSDINKVQAPSILLDDFNYFFNKAIQYYINLKYSVYEVNLQATDDLRVLTKSSKITDLSSHTNEDVFGTSYDCDLPQDYMHILNCICEFRDKNPRCEGCEKIKVGANKLTSNQWPQVITNYYMKPSVKRPYYYIINVSNPDTNPNYTVNKTDGERYGNSSLPTMLIKCGNDRKHYELEAVYIDYIRAPKYIKLTLEQIDSPIDTSQILEFNDYVIYEIINIASSLIMVLGKDPNVQNHAAVNTSIPPIGNR